jgi:heat shock protein HtpX
LRSMAGGASLTDYDNAFRQVHKGGRQIIAPATIAGTGAVGLRPAVPETPQREPEPSKVERTRQVSDLMLRLNDYRTITCYCGTKLKVPPKLKRANIKCPHCGRTNPI